jgi:ATP-dependent Lhr-like helicase
MREVTIIRSAEASRPGTKRIELLVQSPGGAASGGCRDRREDGGEKPSSASVHPHTSALPVSPREAFWNDLTGEITSRIRTNRSTLIFTNTRRHAEKLARLINEREDSQLAYAHHGSLSREIRLVVERKLKAGELSAIVATSSLELGIDIGALDEVLLVQTPFSVSSTLQRIGRAGHGVGELSRGRLYCTHGRDLLNAAVMARSIAAQDIEEIHPVEAPLDLLAQIILSMTAVETWKVDELYEMLRTSRPYHDLPRKHYDLVLEMLAGRYADRSLRELKTRLSWDRLDGTLRAQRAALPLIYRSGGTIPDRGYYDLRIQQNAAKIGELDEEFVWERKVGDTFNLGTQNWKILRIDSKNVEVVPWNGPINITPFWRAEKAGRDFPFSERVALFLEAWNDRLDPPARLVEALVDQHFFDRTSAESLASFLRRQRTVTGCQLPHRHHLLVEHVEGALAQASFSRIILHTLWGSRVNYPFSLILEAAWRQNHRDSNIEVLADDDCVLIIPSEPDGFSVDELLSLVRPEQLERLLRISLEGSGFFAARFRENAGRALLLPRSNLDRRIPLWLTRLRSAKLLEGVAGYGDFPILLETWRSCLQDEFDLPALGMLLGELQGGEIRRSETHTDVPSPFADNISWVQTNEHMYRSEGTTAIRDSTVQEEVIREILYSTRLRPQISKALAADLQSKLQRIAPDYAPAPPEELLDWLKERLLVADHEWAALLQAVRRDHAPETDLVQQITGKLVRYRLPGAESWVVSALEQMPRILASIVGAEGWEVDEILERMEVDEESLSPGSRTRIRIAVESMESGREAAERHCSGLMAEWLRYYGPVPLSWIRHCFGMSQAVVESVLDELVASGAVILDQLTRGTSSLEVCDLQNLEILLRLTRKGARPSFTALPLDRIPLFLAVQQGLVAGKRHRRDSGLKDLRRVLERLFGYPAAARLWEEEIFPARLHPYYGSWLDELLRSSELGWFGCGRQRVSFCFSSDIELYLESADEEAAAELRRLLPSPRGRFSFWDLVDHTAAAPADVTRRIWDLVWEGKLAADSFDVLRRAAAAGFRLPQDRSRTAEDKRRTHGLRRRRPARTSYDRWRAAHPLSGGWYGITRVGEADALEEEELARDRVRQLLQRYGIVFRELVSRELPALQWSRIFRTLRLMELSGEVLSGYFFEGVPGVQFINHQGFRVLQAGLPAQAIFWICAADPASVCGLGLPISGLPPRLASNHLVYHGSRLVLVSTRRAAEVELRVAAECSHIPEYLGVFEDLLNRDVSPRKSIRVDRINGSAARESTYKGAFLRFGFAEEYRGLILRAGY